MSDETFGDNFTWYEWSFVSPEDLQNDNAETEARREPGSSVRPVDERWDDRWANHRR